MPQKPAAAPSVIAFLLRSSSIRRTAFLTEPGFARTVPMESPAAVMGRDRLFADVVILV
jgi:hypothetical protein